MHDAPRSRFPLLHATGAVAARPWLWATAIRQARRLVVPGWWRRPPFLPRPDPAYLRFRLETQYGGGGGGAARAGMDRDVVSYLEWCRAEHGTQTGRSGSRR